MNDEVVEEKVMQNNTSKEIGELVKALAKAQGAIKPAKKDSDVEYTLKSGRRMQRKYADLTSVWDSCRKELSQNNLVVIQTTKGNRGVTVITTLAHESGQWIRGELTMQPGGNDPQSYGSALTYARRYSLAAIVGIATGEDDDAEDATRGKRKEKVKTTYVGNAAVKEEKATFVETGIKLDATNQAGKNEIERVKAMSETEVKDEPVLSEKEAQKEQDRLLDTGKDKPEVGRNQLNIRWHTLVQKLKNINYFRDDKSYREWLVETFEVKSSKELSEDKMLLGISLMAKIYNAESKKEK